MSGKQCHTWWHSQTAKQAATLSDRHMVTTGSSGSNGSLILWEKPVSVWNLIVQYFMWAETFGARQNVIWPMPKTRFNFLIFAFIICASWSHLLGLNGVGIHWVSWDISADDCKGVGLGAELGAVRDGSVPGYHQASSSRWERRDIIIINDTNIKLL